MKRKIIFALVIVMIVAGFLTGGWVFDGNQDISDSLGVDVSQGTVLNYRDSHGGFHGDGTLAVTVSFTQEQVDHLVSQFPEKSGWHAFPLSEPVFTALYGKTAGNHTQGALIWDESIEPMPEITDGWYYFYDRHPNAADPLDASNLFSRGSYNCTIAVLDLDTLTLYYFEIDT